MNNLYQNKYRISTSRASWHNYNSGMYFVTICTKERKHYFGEIVDGMGRDDVHIVSTTGSTMVLSEIGQYADEQLRNVHDHYPYAEIPLWVVMPNHIHAVVIINGKYAPCNDNLGSVETMCTSSLRGQRWKNANINKEMQIISMHRGKLSTVVGGLKRAVTYYAHQHNIPFAWQSRFHDHIIRGTDDMNKIAEYIENNVARWGYDKFNARYEDQP